MTESLEPLAIIKWGHSFWQIIEDAEFCKDDESEMGRTTFLQNIIYIRPGLASHRRTETIWHELSHVILSTFGFTDAVDTERVCDAMSFGLATLLAENECLLNVAAWR